MCTGFFLQILITIEHKMYVTNQQYDQVQCQLHAVQLLNLYVTDEPCSDLKSRVLPICSKSCCKWGYFYFSLLTTLWVSDKDIKATKRMDTQERCWFSSVSSHNWLSWFCAGAQLSNYVCMLLSQPAVNGSAVANASLLPPRIQFWDHSVPNKIERKTTHKWITR